jgi:predicted transcriptional regulator
MAGKTPKISDAELQVLQLLWNEAPLGATDIADRIGQSSGWSLATVKTLLSRLLAKGAVAAEANGRRFRYRPAVAREAVAGKQAGKLVERLFGGRVSPLVAQLAEQRDLDPEDLADLEALVKKLKK